MEQKQFEALLSDAEVRLRRLKMLYEQWFAGFERTEPAVARKEIDDILQRLKREQIRNTGLRFRLHQLQQRHTTFTTYWRRIARQIEEGTYQRDVLRAKKLRDQALREGAEPEISYGTDVDVQLDADMDAALEDVMREAEAAVEQRSAERSVVSFKPAQAAAPMVSTAPAAPAPNAAAPAGASLTPGAPGVKKAPPVPPRPPAGPRSISPFALPLPAGQAGMVSKAPPPPPTAASGIAARAASPASPAAPSTGGNGGLSSDDMKRIYDRYVAARKQNSERVDNVKLETIEKSLRGMLPSFEKKHAGKKIDFEVVVKDGKVALKPVAK